MSTFSTEPTDVDKLFKYLEEIESEYTELDFEEETYFEEDEWYEAIYPDDCYEDAEALASAGFGTDEDYGYYGAEDY